MKMGNAHRTSAMNNPSLLFIVAECAGPRDTRRYS